MHRYPIYTLLMLIAALLGPGCQGGPGEYENHASDTMRRMGDAQPLFDAPPGPAESPASRELPGEIAAMASEDVEAETDGPLTAEDAVPSPAGGANPPSFMRPPPEVEDTRVELTLALDPAAQVQVAAPCTVRFTVKPLVNIAEIEVRYAVEGDGEVSPSSTKVGAGVSGRAILASAQLTLREGRAALTATAVGRDATGAELFTETAHLYFLALPSGRVLSGTESLHALEGQELERQRDAGEITEAEFRQRFNLLHPR